MNLRNVLVEWLASRLQVPSDALDMFKAANRMSGLNRQTLPAELIPLNTRQIARGVLNFTVFQSSPGWVLPYWAERQYDPEDASFIPRSHLGLSLNVTHRNWTAVGTPDCAVEPIVDPRGLLTPRPGSWSLDVWFVVDRKEIFPSRVPSVHQKLMDGVPVVETMLQHHGLKLVWCCYTLDRTLYQNITVSNLTAKKMKCRVALAIRPYNPEGISLIRSIGYDMSGPAFTINGTDRLELSEPPDGLRLSSRKTGDSSQHVLDNAAVPCDALVTCADGLANGFASYDVQVGSRQSWSIRCSSFLVPNQEISLEEKDIHPKQAVEAWEKRLSSGIDLTTPEPSVNAAVKMARATLLMLTDSSTITPGPFMYHQFWFRDAAYMIWALDKFGYSFFTRPIVASFPKRQLSTGYFRSQQGEWDSDGQALWTVWQHAMFTGRKDVLEYAFESLRRGMHWIARTRVKAGSKDGHELKGLLPRGFSAEHLGLSDQYFWDNFWSLAGLEAYRRICSFLEEESERIATTDLIRDYQTDVDRALASASARLGSMAIPPAPLRDLDSGVIGSIVAGYPLQILPPDDRRLAATLLCIEDMFFLDDMYYHQFIHSGLNAYLTLQVGHAWLYAGNRERFWNILKSVLSHATPTWTFPEAIHPLTGGGSMGDGHHGWAAAELMLAVRDALIAERWHSERVSPDLVFLSGVPRSWFEEGREFSIVNAPVAEGKVDLTARRRDRILTLGIRFERGGLLVPGSWTVSLPFCPEAVYMNGKAVRGVARAWGETVLQITAGLPEVEIQVTVPRRR